jgi:hypothetical protein
VSLAADPVNGPVFWKYGGMPANSNAGVVTVDTTASPATVSFQLYNASGSLGSSYLTSLTADQINAGLSPVTVALTGQAVTAGQGSVAPSAGAALTGLAATTAIGTVTALSGQALTAGAGALGVQAQLGLTGQAATAAQGTITPQSSGVHVALSGQSITAATGSLAPQQAQALTGQALATAQGAMTATAGQNVTVALSGLSMTASAGEVGAAILCALTGQPAQPAVGAMSCVADLGLTGQPVTLTPGTMRPHAGFLTFAPGRLVLLRAERRTVLLEN